MFLVCVFFSAQFFFGQELKPNLGAFGIMLVFSIYCSLMAPPKNATQTISKFIDNRVFGYSK